MIKEVTMFTVICDNCGKSSGDNADYSCWNDKESAWDVASESGWIHGDTREIHYCPYCYQIDDNDNVILAPKNVAK
jgi:hypothetical protein